MDLNKTLLVVNLLIVVACCATVTTLFYLGAGGSSFLGFLGLFCIMSKTGGETDEANKSL